MAQTKGTVFDIQRFSTHDGDGIRTTVFLKGCPLRCVWCQNPEGLTPETMLVLRKSACIKCGLCAKACPEVKKQPNGYPDIGDVKPESFSLLTGTCPAGALETDGSLMSADEVVAKVLRDKVFFRKDGGVTFSGGEPFFQFDFLLDLLQTSKQEGLNTAVETSLFTSRPNLEKALPFIDLLYADCKIFSSAPHAEYTGADNKIILENIKYAIEQKGRDVIIRTPLIPGITDTEQNIAEISAFISSINKNVRYELLNYNPLASSKYELARMSYYFKQPLQPLNQSQLEKLYSIAEKNGVQNIIRI